MKGYVYEYDFRDRKMGGGFDLISKPTNAFLFCLLYHNQNTPHSFGSRSMLQEKVQESGGVLLDIGGPFVPPKFCI